MDSDKVELISCLTSYPSSWWGYEASHVRVESLLLCVAFLVTWGGGRFPI